MPRPATKTRPVVVTVPLVLSVALAATGAPSPPEPPQSRTYLEIRCGVGAAPLRVEVPTFSHFTPEDLDRVVALPDPFPPLHLLRFVPLGELRQRLEAQPGGRGSAGVRLRIQGPKLVYERCLISGDPHRDRVTSLIAEWILRRVEPGEARDDLFRSFESEMSAPPRLLVSLAGRPDDVLAFDAIPGAQRDLPGGRGSIAVRTFFPAYGEDPVTGRPKNRSPRRLDPAALVEIELNGTKEERWVFARPRDVEATLPVDVVLRCAVESEREIPLFALVQVGDERLELWTRYRDSVSRREVQPSDDSIEVPGSRYAFRVLESLPSARLVEDYLPTTDPRSGVTALRFAIGGNEPTDGYWVLLGKEITVSTPSGPVTVAFRHRRPGEGRPLPPADGG